MPSSGNNASKAVNSDEDPKIRAEEPFDDEVEYSPQYTRARRQLWVWRIVSYVLIAAVIGASFVTLSLALGPTRTAFKVLRRFHVTLCMEHSSAHHHPVLSAVPASLQDALISTKHARNVSRDRASDTQIGIIILVNASAEDPSWPPAVQMCSLQSIRFRTGLVSRPLMAAMCAHRLGSGARRDNKAEACTSKEQQHQRNCQLCRRTHMPKLLGSGTGHPAAGQKAQLRPAQHL